ARRAGSGHRAAGLPRAGPPRPRRPHRSPGLAGRRAPPAGCGGGAEMVLCLTPGAPVAGAATAAGALALGGGTVPPRWETGTGPGRLSGPQLARAASAPGVGVSDLVLR